MLELHSFLNEQDECYFFIEKTSGRDYSYSKANNLISNLKKKPSTKDTAQWDYKLQAMTLCSNSLGTAINHNWLRDAVLVPIPPSKAKDHPEYDDRMKVICEQLDVPFDVDVRDLVTHHSSHEAVHEGGHRLSPTELMEIFEIDESLTAPEPTKIGIIDDVLTAGSHYRAMHTLYQPALIRTHVPISSFRWT